GSEIPVLLLPNPPGVQPILANNLAPLFSSPIGLYTLAGVARVISGVLISCCFITPGAGGNG
uniref:FtsK_4TM domain-containing protein n=1 Tax=Schistosoma curassoni TaxID=6186 RepID=A0A183KCT9_9TREM